MPTPAQTAGPFLSLGLDRPGGHLVVAPEAPGAIHVGGRVFDGNDDPVTDALIETWQASPVGGMGDADGGFARVLTAPAGYWEITTVKPGPSPAPGGGTQAPHIDVAVFARGLLRHLVTRLYFADEGAANAADPVLSSLPDASARATLVAGLTDRGYRFDIHLQGPDATVFFAL